MATRTEERRDSTTGRREDKREKRKGRSRQESNGIGQKKQRERGAMPLTTGEAAACTTGSGRSRSGTEATASGDGSGDSHHVRSGELCPAQPDLYDCPRPSHLHTPTLNLECRSSLPVYPLPLLTHPDTMISDSDLHRLAIFLGSCSMMMVVLYHFLQVNAQDDEADADVAAGSSSKSGNTESSAGASPVAAGSAIGGGKGR